jgi:release factor glutamine methyltransferase
MRPLEQYVAEALSEIGAVHELRWILDAIEAAPEAERQAKAADIVARRRKDEPLAYVLGSWAFRRFEFLTGPGTLIPRPETEELVEEALKRLMPLAHQHGDTPFVLVDAGAGTGCIGLSLAAELLETFPKLKIDLTLIERSPLAIGYIRRNVELFKPILGHTECRIFEGSWQAWPVRPAHAFLSNPPYVTPQEYGALDLSVRGHEPVGALVPDDAARFPDASGPYRDLLDLAGRALSSGGWLGFEMGLAQTEWMDSHARVQGAWVEQKVVPDMTGRNRFFFARKS